MIAKGQPSDSYGEGMKPYWVPPFFSLLQFKIIKKQMEI